MKETNKKQNLVFVYPTYNERENILKVIKETQKVAKEISNYKTCVLIVDDNSPDGTSKIVSDYQKKNNNIKLLNGQPEGLGRAMIRGIKFAIKKLKADIIVTNESDMSYLPRDSKKLVMQIEKGMDVVVASRILTNEHAWPVERKVIHWVSNKIFAEFIAGVREVKDHNCAFRAFRVKKVLDQVDFKNFPTGFSFFNYLVYKLSRITKKVSNCSIRYYPRTHGESKISFKPKYLGNMIYNFYEYFVNCLNIRRERLIKY